ncbi:MAG: NAD+ synthase [Bacteroidota bacterium]
MKIALAQLNFHIGNFDYNVNKIISSISRARSLGAELIVFPELSICGYPPRDFLEFDDFIAKCETAVSQIAEHCQGIAAIVGLPSKNNSNTGKPLFNSACFIEDQKVKKYIHKGLLPNYDVFDEYRYFEPAAEFEIVTYKDVRIALTVCEDIWEEEIVETESKTGRKFYKVSPMDELMKQKPTIAINISASPFNYNQDKTRKHLLNKMAKKHKIPFIYLNQVGGQTELIFDGGSMVVGEDGSIKKQMLFFEEDFLIVESHEINDSPKFEIEKTSIELIYQALVLGIKDYFTKLNFSKAILGLSGGIDSALTLVLAVEALGKENVLAVLLPSKYSSDHSVSDSLKLVETLGCNYQIIPIENGVASVEDSLKELFAGQQPGIAEENIQARMRAIILMAISNKFGYILLNTSNKSEAAVGYGTLYGDMCGGLSVIGDLFKTQVYELSNYINKEKEIIPQNIISKPPSAELRPNQKDSDSLPDYDVLDKILSLYIEEREGPQEIINMGFDTALVNRIFNLVNRSEYKRQQTPPILRVSKKAFGQGRRMQIVADYSV